MQIKQIFIADDGTIFDTEFECKLYEDKQLSSKLEGLKEYVTLFGFHGNVLPYNTFSSPTYVYIKKLPEYNNQEFMYLWKKLLNGRLCDIVNVCRQTGWYIKGNNDCWYCWGNIEKDFRETEEKIAKMQLLLNY
jgi:hypothetical protein